MVMGQGPGGTFDPEEYRFESFVHWTLHDAWRARDPGLVDRELDKQAGWAVSLGDPKQRGMAALHVLHASQLEAGRDQIRDYLDAGERPSVTAVDGLVQHNMGDRRPLAELQVVAQSIAQSSHKQLRAYAQNPEVPPDIKSASLRLDRAIKTLPADTGPGPAVRREGQSPQARQGTN